MSSLKVPQFDLLTGQPGPYEGFGVAVAAEGTRLKRLQAAMEEARQRVEDGFACRLSKQGRPGDLDSIIGEMWQEGWDPAICNVNLFATDFGLVLTQKILLTLGGRVIIRSPEDPSHLSVHWPTVGVEAFPFHKVLKCLVSREGESTQSFLDGLREYLPSGQ